MNFTRRENGLLVASYFAYQREACVLRQACCDNSAFGALYWQGCKAARGACGPLPPFGRCPGMSAHLSVARMRGPSEAAARCHKRRAHSDFTLLTA
jgi:hypothetical protein